MGIGTPRGCKGLLLDVRGVLGAGRDSRYSGARRGIRSIGAPRECQGAILGTSGAYRGGKWTGSLTTLGPKSRVPAFPLVPLGE